MKATWLIESEVESCPAIPIITCQKCNWLASLPICNPHSTKLKVSKPLFERSIDWLIDLYALMRWKNKLNLQSQSWGLNLRPVMNPCRFQAAQFQERRALRSLSWDVKPWVYLFTAYFEQIFTKHKTESVLQGSIIVNNTGRIKESWPLVIERTNDQSKDLVVGTTDSRLNGWLMVAKNTHLSVRSQSLTTKGLVYLSKRLRHLSFEGDRPPFVVSGTAVLNCSLGLKISWANKPDNCSLFYLAIYIYKEYSSITNNQVVYDFWIHIYW